MAPSPEPELRDLLVDPSSAGQAIGALDKTARFGEAYEYTAQRIVQVTGNATGAKQTMELAGEVSAPIRVDVVDTFPPAIPQELVAVLVSEEKTIDLSWQPDTDEDLAGYIVYRAEADRAWKRISGPQPLTGAAYRDTTVEAGHSYRYAVTAIDLTGHESRRSPEAGETVPDASPIQ
jgi:fibronectin type 3 domain-containing protein